MALTNSLKKQIDLPVWEWLRPLPASTTSVSAMTTANNLQNRYIYYLVGATFQRYDTISDSWHTLAIPQLTPATFAELGYVSNTGHPGRAIGSGGGNNTIEMAALNGNALVGLKIRITAGTGAGQERTITAVSAPIVKDRGAVTTSSTQQIVDASSGVLAKQWQPNQYRDYQVRVDYGTGVTQVRPILWNSASTLAVYDANFQAATPWWGPILSSATAASAGSLYQIESNIVTVDTNWSVNPDSTSQFMILGGGIWCLTSQSGTNWIGLQYYDVVADMWYLKTWNTTHFQGTPTDACFERWTEAGGAIATGTATSGAARSLTKTAAGMTVGQYANFELRITAGTGIGQSRTVLTNTADTFYVTRDWDVTPDNTSVYAVYRDTDKLMVMFGGLAAMGQYSVAADQMVLGKLLDFGAARRLSYRVAGQEPIGVTSIARTTGGVTSLNATPTAAGSGYLIDQLLTITTGGTNAVARITGVNTSGGVTSVILEACGSGYTTGTGKATTVSPAGGSGCTLEIVSIGDIATVTCPLTAHNVRLGETVIMAGANQSDYNGSKTVIGVNSATTFQYVVLNTPATPATYTDHSTTQLVDVTKNWSVNEHVGKIVQICPTGTLGAGSSQARRITANTSNTLTFATATAPSNGTGRYAIHDPKPFSTEMSVGARTGGGRAGIATSGSTTSLTDTTKNWPVNYWSTSSGGGGRKVRIVAGAGAGQELQISSNSATTLNFATATAVDSTSVYVIMDCFGVATGGSTTTVVDATQNWGTNIWTGKRVRIVSGTGPGVEATVTSNTANTLTFAAVNAAIDTTSSYAILEPPARGTGIHMDCVTSSSAPAMNNRYLYVWRGGGTAELDQYDFTTEQTNFITYFPQTETLSSGSMYVYDGGDRIYFTKDATGRVMFYDVVKNTVTPASTVPYGMGTAVLGNRMEVVQTEDNLKFLYMARHNGQEFWRNLLWF